MSTQLPRYPPGQAIDARRFPFTCTVLKTTGSASGSDDDWRRQAVEGQVDLKCNFAPVSAGSAPMWADSNTAGRLEIWGWFPTIKLKSRLVLTMQGQVKRFIIDDINPGDGGYSEPRTTLLTLSRAKAS